MSEKLERPTLDLGQDPTPKTKTTKGKRRRKVTVPKRTAKIEIRVFEEEKTHIEALALEALKTPSEYIRDLAKATLTQADIQDRIDKAVAERVKYLELEYQTRLSIALAEEEAKVEIKKKQFLESTLKNMTIVQFIVTRNSLKSDKQKGIGTKK